MGAAVMPREREEPYEQPNEQCMLPDLLLILLVGFVLMKTPAKKYLLGQDLT